LESGRGSTGRRRRGGGSSRLGSPWPGRSSSPGRSSQRPRSCAIGWTTGRPCRSARCVADLGGNAANAAGERHARFVMLLSHLPFCFDRLSALSWRGSTYGRSSLRSGHCAQPAPSTLCSLRLRCAFRFRSSARMDLPSVPAFPVCRHGRTCVPVMILLARPPGGIGSRERVFALWAPRLQVRCGVSLRAMSTSAKSGFPWTRWCTGRGGASRAHRECVRGCCVAWHGGDG
jgi:hypothetical protein